jgi:hypothetical protein
MTCERLVCAVCAGPVVEGRCATCRISRAHVHGAAPFGLTPQLIAVLATVLALLSLLAAHVR